MRTEPNQHDLPSSVIPKKKRVIEDDEDEEASSSKPSSSSLSATKRALLPRATTAVESPGWLSSRNGAFLPPSQRQHNIELARLDRRIPKKNKPRVESDHIDENVLEAESWESAVRNKASTKSILDEDDLVEDDSPLSGRRFFKGALSKGVGVDSRKTRLLKRNEAVTSSHPSKKKKKVASNVIRDDEDDDESSDSDGSVGDTFEEDVVSPIDVRSKAHRIFETCENISRDLQRELHQWEGGSGASRSSKASSTCVDLADIALRGGKGDRLITEADISVICPALTLKAYQLVGINWLQLLHDKNVNGVLADDMGLGKTVQTIAFLAHLKATRSSSRSIARPHLIVVPASTLANWENELDRFCPSLVVHTYHGSQNERLDMRRELRNGFEAGTIDVLLSTYTLFERESGGDDRKFLHNQTFEYLILDEAHGIKNSASARFTQLNRVKTKHRLLISGTPVQNELKELLSLLSFLMPTVFSSSDCQILLEAFGQAKRNETSSSALSLSKMRNVLAPFVLRRIKKHVLSQLVEKEVEFVMLPMTSFQSIVYNGIIQAYTERKLRLKGEVLKDLELDGLSLANIIHDTSEATSASVSSASSSAVSERVIDLTDSDEALMQRELSASEANSLFTALRKAANHPLLLRIRFTSPEVMQRIADVTFQLGHFGMQCDMKMVVEELGSFSDFDLHQVCMQYQTYLGQLELDGSCLYDSSKMVWLKEHVPHMVTEGHRVLIFSQWTRILDLLEVLLEELGMEYLRLDGSTPVSERQALIDTFSSENIPIFLLSTKAGGLGINLTQADVCIMHDLDFNPENDRQAEDRCHRIGQTKPVKVYKLVTINTVDEEIMRIGEKKKLLSEALLSDSSLTKKSGDDAGEIGQILQRAIQSRLKCLTGSKG